MPGNTSIRLGELDSPARTAAAKLGVGLGEWIRRLVARKLARKRPRMVPGRKAGDARNAMISAKGALVRMENRLKGQRP